MISAISYTLLPPTRYILKGGIMLIEIIDTHNDNDAVMTFTINNEIYGTGIVFLKNELNREFDSYTKEVQEFCNIRSVWV